MKKYSVTETFTGYLSSKVVRFEGFTAFGSRPFLLPSSRVFEFSGCVRYTRRMSINRIVLVGRLTRDPELRTTTTGKSVVEFSIAVDKQRKPVDGSNAADFFRVKAWGATADFVNNYLSKGRLVAVDGRIEQRRWQAPDGQNRETYEVVAEQVQILDRPRDDAQSKPAAEEDYDPFEE